MARALVISQSHIDRDSRVLRQVGWLLEAGWDVDTLGLGPLPDVRVGRHFEMAPEPSWTRPRPVKALIHLIPSFRTRFRLLSAVRIPSAASDAIRAGDYELVVFEDVHLIPWTADADVFGPHRDQMRIHLDIHEFHPPSLGSDVVGRRLVDPYYRWSRGHIPSSAFDTRSVVAEAYADVYVEEFGFARPTVVRNAPPAVDQRPHAVDPTEIKLLYHGGAFWPRGLRQIVEALDDLDDRFTMTFMLTGPAHTVAELRAVCAGRPRVAFVPSVGVDDVARAVNAYDLEIMFYPPVTRNLQLALPNKLFEAIQGRLGLVVGNSPSMRDIVERFGNGLVVEGWTGADLSRTLNTLDAAAVGAMKVASEAAALELNAEHERDTFLALIAAATGT